jgi:hypothetical protein
MRERYGHNGYVAPLPAQLARLRNQQRRSDRNQHGNGKRLRPTQDRNNKERLQ